MTVDPADTSLLPQQPGVYKYFNLSGKLIYVGKAKNIRKRVKSYFTAKRNHSRKTLKLVSEISKIEAIITPTEFDALLLENNLIKANQPKYNILLKDDKTFPYICISNDRFPRIYSTRQHTEGKGHYFGPYTSVVAMNNVLKLIQKLYTIRNCKYNLSDKNVTAKKYKLCLEYQIGNCQGPCEGLQSEDNYLKDVKQAEHILKGNLATVKNYFKERMIKASEQLVFEEAQLMKEKLNLVEKFSINTIVVNPRLGDLHIISIIADDAACLINYMYVNKGAIIQSQTSAVKNRLDQELPEVLRSVIGQLVNFKETSEKTTILSNVDIPDLPDIIDVVVPKIGDKRKLVELSLKNAFSLKKERKSNIDSEPKGSFAVQQLKEDLSLTKLPNHIECFDNSNLQGTNPVASMVCFKDGKPSKKDYRKFKIKTIVGPDDFGSMNEIVRRRYSRLLSEESPLPDLIVVDGGKGQLSAAVGALKELGIYGQVAIVGIAKRLEEIYVPNDSIPLHISKKSASLKLIQRLRDEAHRFAITFHRDQRSKELNTELENITGIGKSTADKLLKKFKSVKKIKEASTEEIINLIGKAKGNIIIEAIKKGSIARLADRT
ncbi:MAG: excinuclease ABC subunit C [Thiotrichaceae bacterium]|nr:excinuclease ABC subunit C [Thiotrichaceae bacterium]